MNQTSSKTILVPILGLLPLIMVLGNSMFIPLIPEVQAELQLTPVQAGLVLTVFSIPAAVMIPLIGFMSDRFGRKKMVLSSLVLIMVGSLCSAIALYLHEASFSFLLFGRLLQGIGAGGTAPLAMALVGDLFDGKDRSQALGVLEVFNGVGKVISPILGAVIAAVFAWYGSFYFYFLLAAIAFLALLVYLKSSPFESEQRFSLKKYVSMIGSVLKREGKWIIPIFFTNGIALFLLFGMLYFLSFELEGVYDIVGVMRGVYLAIPLFALGIVSYWTGTFVGENVQKMKQALFIGFFLIVMAFACLIYYHHLIGLLLFLSLAAAGMGLFLPAASTAVTSSIGKEERGFIVSLYNMVRFLGVAFGPVIFSVWMVNLTQMYYWSFFLAFVSIFILTAFWSCIPFVKQCV
ncbi:MFS transporter [Alkalihalobacterium bogoriense]|uniref:MFS transporter n=1 Tax=Alkalihalobacterium bogoriense TaxID=246272 RepID=UPI000687531A|nr:MFS transporter [Alkalihalobacterium bogoriense]